MSQTKPLVSEECSCKLAKALLYMAFCRWWALLASPKASIVFAIIHERHRADTLSIDPIANMRIPPPISRCQRNAAPMPKALPVVAHTTIGTTESHFYIRNLPQRYRRRETRRNRFSIIPTAKRFFRQVA